MGYIEMRYILTAPFPCWQSMTTISLELMQMINADILLSPNASFGACAAAVSGFNGFLSHYNMIICQATAGSRAICGAVLRSGRWPSKARRLFAPSLLSVDDIGRRRATSASMASIINTRPAWQAKISSSARIWPEIFFRCRIIISLSRRRRGRILQMALRYKPSPLPRHVTLLPDDACILLA